MAESKETPKSNKNDKNNGKSWFSSSWLFAILLLTFIVFQVLTTGKYTQKAGQREIEEMVMNHDIEKVIVVNEEQAEIYIKADSLKSGRYPDFAENRGFGLQPPSHISTIPSGLLSCSSSFLRRHRIKPDILKMSVFISSTRRGRIILQLFWVSYSPS